MTITLYESFSKRENSTKRPTEGTEKSIALKNGTSVINPTFVFSGVPNMNWNYVKWENNYYYITDIALSHNTVWEIDCRLDVLATYKTEIGNYSAYVVRSGSASDGMIRDSLYPITCKKSVESVVMDDYPYTTFGGGYYVIAVAGTNTGASTLYQLTPANFTTLIKQLLGTIDDTTPIDVIEAVKNSIFEPMQYINSVMWFPASFTTSSTTNVRIGKWESGVSAGIISSTVKSLYNKTINLPKHPQSARGSYLNCSPYSQYILEFDPFGTINLDTSQMATISSINLQVWVDALTGQGILKVKGSGGTNATACLASVTTQLGVPVKVTSSTGVGGSVATAVAAVGRAVTSVAEIGLPGVGSIADAITGSVSNVGSAGSIASNSLTKVLSAVFYEITDENLTEYGRPLCKVRTINTLSGFVQTGTASISIPGHADEAIQINNALNSGIFYE